MGFYDDMQAVAAGVLGEFKQGAIKLTRVTTETPNPAKPWLPVADTSETYELEATAKAVSDKFIDGTLILATDKEVTCAVPKIEPVPGDVISIDGNAHSIVKVMRIPAAGVAVVFKLIVRG